MIKNYTIEQPVQTVTCVVFNLMDLLILYELAFGEIFFGACLPFHIKKNAAPKYTNC